MTARLRSIFAGEDKTALGVLVVALIAFAVVAVDTGWVNSRFQPGGKLVRARFHDTGQLKRNDEIRIDGIKIGRVAAIHLDPDGRSATVDMLLQDAARPVYRDARATIRFRTALGGNFAIDLKRGTPAAGALGSQSIPLAQTANQVEIEDVLAFDRGGGKQGLRVMLRELPPALADRRAPATALSKLANTSPRLALAVSAIRGRDQRDLRPLIADTAKTVRALDTPTDSVHAVVEGAAVTMATTARRDADLQRLLELGGGIQREVRRTLAQLDATLRLADPLVARLHAPARSLAPALADLRPTLVGGDHLLARARPLLRRLRPAVSALAGAARLGRPLLANLQPSLARLADTILPELATTDPVSKLKTYELIGPVIASLNSAASTFDTEGHLFRFPALGGQRALSDELPCATFFGDPESPDRIRCQSLSSALQTYFRWRPTASR